MEVVYREAYVQEGGKLLIMMEGIRLKVHVMCNLFKECGMNCFLLFTERVTKLCLCWEVSNKL